ncbi:MAG: glucose-6-phosphate dehydrogenase [Caldilineae bacterium]|nr:MAG: glucose-6-phosphate dehydrogenase [Caldilineae bacterium]
MNTSPAIHLDQIRRPSPATLVIFGASGDLAYRKLVPALHTLSCVDLLPEDFVIVGAARSNLSHEQFRARMQEGVQKFGRLSGDACGDWDEFASHLYYHRLTYDKADDYRDLARYLQELEDERGLPRNRLFYLSTPPTLYAPIVQHLGQAGLSQTQGEFTRVIVEKPFGTDLASARQLNQEIHQVFREDQVYRIDHYLGKETVQNIMVFRFANLIWEPIWNRRYIDHVQISVLETVDVGRRGGYYDQAGVLRDMFQNHLMQLLTLTAMEPPTAWDATLLRDEKVKVLRAVRPPQGNAIRTNTVRAQYRSQDGRGPTYRKEPGVAPDSQTPTYAALELYIDNWRWQGVPFYLRSGKCLAKKMTEVVIQFKEVPHMLFDHDEQRPVAPNQLSFCLQPDEGFHLGFQTKVPGAGMRTRTVDMTFHFAGTFGEKALPQAYERLLLDALLGDASLFARADEIEYSWRIIDTILQGWEGDDAPPLSFYEPGTWGPAAADVMLAASGRAWAVSCVDTD